MNGKVYCNGTRIKCLQQMELTVGMVGAEVEFDFSEEWDGLGKLAVFRSDGSRDVIVDENGVAVVPHEILTTPGMDVEVGVYAVREDGTTWPAPTPFCKLTRNGIAEGADPSGDESYPPTPDVGEQAVAAASKALEAAAEAQEVAADIQRRADAGEFDGRDGAQGEKGDKGDKGDPGTGKAYVQPDEPIDAPIGTLWYDTDEETSGGGTSTTLPNPHKLTFSGAVSAEYDGSEPVEVVIPEGGGSDGAATETWQLLADITLEEEVTGIETEYFATPQRKIRVVLDTLAAETVAVATPVRVRTGTVNWNRLVFFYPDMVPDTTTVRSLCEVEVLGEGKAMVAWNSVKKLDTSNGRGPEFAHSFRGGGRMLLEPVDSLGNAINDGITGFEVSTYSTFVAGTRLRVWGVAK